MTIDLDQLRLKVFFLRCFVSCYLQIDIDGGLLCARNVITVPASLYSHLYDIHTEIEMNLIANDNK